MRLSAVVNGYKEASDGRYHHDYIGRSIRSQPFLSIGFQN
jgi:hypothetical protein